MPTSVELIGEKELRRTLKEAGDDLADLKAAHGEAAGIAAQEGRMTAPWLSGKLSGSVRSSGTKTAAIVRAGGAKVPYANIQEWGWPRHNIAPTHFLRDAAKATEPEWTEQYRQAVERILAKIRGA